jgi:hypothetical protein
MQRNCSQRSNDMKTPNTGHGPVTATAARKLDVPGSVAEFYTTGIERLAEIQKQGIDLAIQQNAALVGVWKGQVEALPAVSKLFRLDLAITFLEQLVDTQKGAIDLLVEQSQAFVTIVKKQQIDAAKSADEGVAMAREAIEQSVVAQKTALDYSAKQTKAAFASAKKQFGYAGTPAEAATDSVQRGMEVVIEAQKGLLDAFKTPVQFVH